jgi:hypothetical protein
VGNIRSLQCVCVCVCARVCACVCDLISRCSRRYVTRPSPYSYTFITLPRYRGRVLLEKLMVPEALSLGLKRPEREANYSSPSGDEVRNA